MIYFFLDKNYSSSQVVLKDRFQVFVRVYKHLVDLKRVLTIGYDPVHHHICVVIHGSIVRVQQDEHGELITILRDVDVVRSFVECQHAQLAASWKNMSIEPECFEVGIREQRHTVRGYARDVEFDVLT